LMGQETKPWNNIFATEVLTQFGGTSAFEANNGAYQVGVLNLLTANGKAAQDQLVLFNVPDASSTAGLMLLGVGGLLVVARSKRTAAV
jgi:hypothetical protein